MAEDDKQESWQTNMTDGAEQPSCRQLFGVWLRIGLTSFGSIAQYLIQENFIYKYKWLSAGEYANIVAMSQLAPGINLLSYTILIGRRLAGWKGIAASLLGFTLPSAVLAMLITYVYASLSELPKVQSALRAVFAALFGIALATNWRNAGPVLAENYRKRGAVGLLVMTGIMTGSAVVYLLWNPSVVILYLAGGLCGAVFYWYRAVKSRGMGR